MTNSTVNRILRVAFGSSLIVATMSVSTAPLGGFAILPLLAIPLILSGIYGENPLAELTTKAFNAMKTRASDYASKVFKHGTAAV
jgi:hypothetical protein